MTFRFDFRDFFGVANLIWPELFSTARLGNMNEIGTGFIEFGGHSVENGRRKVSKG